MKVKIILEDSFSQLAGNPISIGEVDKVLAATESFPYWTFWYPENEDGETRVRFFPMKDIKEVDMLGKDEDKHLATVTNIDSKTPGGAQGGTV